MDDPLSTDLSFWSMMAHDFSLSTNDKIGFVLIKTMELTRVASDGETSIEDLEFAMKSLDDTRSMTYKIDQERTCPLRGLLYGLSVCVSIISQSVLLSYLDFPSQTENGESLAHIDGEDSMDGWNNDEIFPYVNPFGVKFEEEDETMEKYRIPRILLHSSVDDVNEPSIEESEDTVETPGCSEMIAVEDSDSVEPMRSNCGKNGEEMMEIRPLTIDERRINMETERDTQLMKNLQDKEAETKKKEGTNEAKNRRSLSECLKESKRNSYEERMKELKKTRGDPKQTRQMICSVANCQKLLLSADKLISHHYNAHKRSMWEFPSWISCDSCPPCEIFHSDAKKAKHHTCDSKGFMLNYYDSVDGNKTLIDTSNIVEGSRRKSIKKVDYREDWIENETPKTVLRSRKRKLNESIVRSASRSCSNTHKIECLGNTKNLERLGLKLNRFERLECPQCKKSCANCSQLFRHLDTHKTTLSMNLVFKCRCSFLSRDKGSVVRHSKKKGDHEFEVLRLEVDSLDGCEQVLITSCGVCKETMRDVIDLLDHLETQHGSLPVDLEGFVVCPCGYPFIEKKPLEYHVNNSECLLRDMKLYVKKRENI